MHFSMHFENKFAEPLFNVTSHYTPVKLWGMFKTRELYSKKEENQIKQYHLRNTMVMLL